MTTSNQKTYKVRRYFSFNFFGDPLLKLGGFLEAVFDLWKASWRLPKGFLEASGGFLEASGEPLGGSWGQLGSILDTLLPEKLPRCAEEGPKTQRGPRGP